MSEAPELRTTGAIRRFEDFVAWQKARRLTSDVYRVTNEPAWTRDRDLVRQIRRAAVSVMANIAEGFERGRPGEFHQFLSTAKASCAELRSHFYVASDAGFLAPAQFQTLMASAEELSNVIGGLRASVERRRDGPTRSSLITHHSSL